MMFNNVARKAVAVVSEPANLCVVSDLVRFDCQGDIYSDTVISDST